MTDAAAASAGGRVIMATCYDERHPPENVIDGNDATFWVTTGLYPQELVVALPMKTDVTRITTVSMHVKKIVIEKCETDRPVAFEKTLESELSNMGNRTQNETHQVNFRAKFVKVIFESGYEPFAAMSKLSIITAGDVGRSRAGGNLGMAPAGYDEEEEDEF